MKKLKRLGIANTDIDTGLEYLIGKKLDEVPFISFPWDTNIKIGKRSRAKVEVIYQELYPYVLDIGKGKYDLENWSKDKLIELKEENEGLCNKLITQKNQIKELAKKLEISNQELVARKKSELEQLLNNSKSKLDKDFQGYLEIFLHTQQEDDIREIAKRNLLLKIEEKELQALFTKQKEVNELEEQLTNLQYQKTEQKELIAQIQIPD